ncbi:hypothetical protein BDW67DRAFT_179083 [Aspergillus spinulosporus]
MSLAYTSYLHLATTLPPVLLGKYYHKHGTQPGNQVNHEREDEQIASLELPLILAFHPVTIVYPTDILDLPSPGRLALQVLGLFLVEGLCRRLIRSLVLPVTFKLRKELDEDQDQDDGGGEHTADDEIATNAVVDFSTARVALMLHPLSMAGWAIIDQILRNL